MLPPFRVLGSVIVVLGWPVFTLNPVLQSPFPQTGGPTVGLWSESGQPEESGAFLWFGAMITTQATNATVAEVTCRAVFRRH